MDSVSRNLFRALHEGKWLSIEYKNLSGQTTNFWGSVCGLNPRSGMVQVDGMHLHDYTVKRLFLHIDGIQSAKIVEGTWCERNEALIKDIAERPHAYARFFTHITNLKVLDYLAACSQLDSMPYKANYQLIHKIDESQFQGGKCPLTDEQFVEIVTRFQQKTAEPHRPGEPVHITSLGLNLISLNTRQGLYVLAYRPLRLDVRSRCLTAGDVVLCREFCLDYKNDPRAAQSIRFFLDGDDITLLDDFERNQERIKDCITRQNPELGGVDDMPYLIAIGRDCLVDLQTQYNGILALYGGESEKDVPVPIRAFFGELTKEPPRRGAVPLALLNDKVNLDQLLAMNHAFRNQLAYVQGPPGTGKTNTILNVLTTAFFNERTVLFASYNNHPIDGVVEKLQNLEYKGQKIPFPIIRLGSNAMVKEAIATMRAFWARCQQMQVFEETLDRNKKERTVRAREQLVILSNMAQLDRLHSGSDGDDDLYELVQYTRTQGESQVSEKPANSRALGIKPYSTRTESAFLENLNHALDNALLGGSRCVVHKEVPISQVFADDAPGRDLFYTGRFDFVVYQKQGREELPLLAIELDGLEHHSDPAVQARDRQKDAICREHGFELIRVENSYARRYHYIKDILIAYFKNA